MTAVPPIFSSSREAANFFVLFCEHEVEPRAFLAQPQLQRLRRVRESVANHRAGLGDAKRNDRRVGTQLSLQIELLLRLLQPHLVENLLRGRRFGAGASRHDREDGSRNEDDQFVHDESFKFQVLGFM